MKGSLEAWKFGCLEEPQRLEPKLPPLAAMVGRYCAPENGERRTENRTRGKRATGGAAGRAWEVYPAGLTRRTTKNHEDTRSTMQGEPQITEDTEEHREDRGTQRGAAC